LNAQRLEAAESTAEPDPELVVVFDLVGTADDFARAVQRIEGLEFLAEFKEDPADPDDDFYAVDAQGERLDELVPETLYMIMSNAQAAAELIRLFELWSADPSLRLPLGLAPLKQVFVLLRAVRRWGPDDRVRETGLLEAWQEDVAVMGQSGVTRVEIELWFRVDAAKRNMGQAEVERMITAVGGQVVQSAVIEGVDYHGILADLPYSQVEAVVQQGADSIELLRTESVMFVAPARPMTVLPPRPAPGPADLSKMGAVPSSRPRVALLDGLPLANHHLLADRLVIDDPDDYSRHYSASNQHHGTAMASLICHGDLSEIGPSLTTQLYVRPIMQPHPFYAGVESIPSNELLVDLVHRSFVRMFEGDGGGPPSAPSVRIVNLSIGDPVRVFTRRMSPLARLLDWLSREYNVLILVSAGNHSFQADVSLASLDNPDALQREVVAGRYKVTRHMGLLSPAEATNALTVSAVHADAAAIESSDTVVDAVPAGLPALYGAVGFGFRRSVKPEILMPGGRQLFQRPVASGDSESASLIQAQHSATGPGVLVAAPSPGGGPTGTAYSYGTSNSVALATRLANEVFDVLGNAAPSDEFQFPDAQYHPVLTKTLLVHAAEWGESAEMLRRILGLQSGTWRRDITQILGYGAVEPTRVATAARTRVVLLGAGSIIDKQRQTFRLPLPPALAASTEWRRLTITLGWFSSINPRSRQYRQARLRFSPPNGALGGDRSEADFNAVRMGTLQHEIFEGRRALAFTAGAAAEVHVDCRVDAGRLAAPVRYGLAVSIEMSTSVRVDIHAQVQQALRADVRARTQVAPR
jgi:hypothetical protein